MQTEFIPIDYDYFDFEGKNYIKLFGRNKNDKKICVIDEYEPNFWVILKKGSEKKAEEISKKIEKIEVEKANRKTKVVKTEIHQKKFLGNPVTAIKIFVTNHKDSQEIAIETSKIKEIEYRREHDLNIITKYIKEKNINPLQNYLVEGDLVSLEDFGGIANVIETPICIKANKIKEGPNKELIPKVLAYDIETDGSEIGSAEIYMISLYGRNLKKVLTWKDSKEKQDFVEVFKNEADMLEGFVASVKEYDPDILTGYFSDGFDLPSIKSSAQKNKIKIPLGLDGTEPRFTRGRIPTGKISGIVHVDVYRFIDAVFSQYLQSETLSLDEVAKELIGEEKEDFDFARLSHMTSKDWADFFSYNLQDSRVTYNLFNKILPDILEFTRIIKEPLFEITRDRMSSHVENYMIHNLDRFNEIAEKRPLNEEIGKRRSLGKYEGAFVFEPKPGLYENLVMFDFTSMYGSVIVSYNLSKSTHLGQGKFSKEEGFFPIMLAEVIEMRKIHKKEYTKNPSGILKARSNAYKLLSNAAYGYQGFFGARYYCREAAAATARLAKENILSAIDKIEKEGYTIIYSDTDSIAFLRGEKSHKQVKDFLKILNEKLPGIMELDLEDFYNRGLFVSKRTTKTGAKKKYALIDEKDNIKIRGFETVRRDWCRLTRNLQSAILDLVLKEGNEKNALNLFKRTVEDLKKRKVGLDELVIKTQLKKPINEYLAEGPHVVAAKKMENREIPVSTGMVIEYFIGENANSGKRVGDRVFLLDEKAPYDIEYYLNNQVLPAVENIFEVFGINVREVIEGETQKKLF